MAGSALFGLKNEVDPRVLHGLSHKVCFVSDDGVDVPRGNDRFGGRDDVGQQGHSANFVQNFWIFRLKPRSLAGGHDGDRGARTLRFGHWLPLYREARHRASSRVIIATVKARNTERGALSREKARRAGNGEKQELMFDCEWLRGKSRPDLILASLYRSRASPFAAMPTPGRPTPANPAPRHESRAGRPCPLPDSLRVRDSMPTVLRPRGPRQSASPLPTRIWPSSQPTQVCG